jgi:ATP/maltotriose-dependent transcriptional regulator MalT
MRLLSEPTIHGRLDPLYNRSRVGSGDRDMSFDPIRVGFAGEQQRLSQRESAIVSLIATGQSNKAIAIQLGVAPETIKTHLKRIFIKLSAHTRAEAVVRAKSTRPATSALGQRLTSYA